MAIRILSSENITGNITLYHPSNAPYINFVENTDISDSKARITMDQVDTNNGTLLFATENAGTLYNQVKITQTGNLLLSNDAASFNTSNAKLNVLPASSGVYQQWNYSPSNENFSLKLKETVTSGNVRYVFEQINNSTTYPNILVFNSGNVGIGTDEPGSKLEVAVADSSSILELTRTGAASFSTLISDVGAGAAQLWFNADTDDTGFLFRPRDSAGTPNNAFLIAPDGNVGIGTTSPDQTGYGYKTLTIMGGTTAGYAGVLELLTPSTDANGQNLGIVSFGSGGTRNAMIAAVRQSGNNNAKLQFWTAAGANGIENRMTIDADGQVGIGTDSPSAQLHINNDTSNSYATLRLEGANRGGIIEMYNQTSYPVSSWTTDQSGNIFFATSGAFAATSLSTKFTILTGGNVGIGTTSPSQKLEVIGNVSLGLSSTTTRTALIANTFGYSTSWKTLTIGSAGTNYQTDAVSLCFNVILNQNSSGSFTGDGSELFFRNVAYFKTPNSSNNGYLNPLTFNNGNVGIGTTSPVSTWLSGFDPSTGNGTFKLTSEGWITTPYLTGLAGYYPGQGARPIVWADDSGTNLQCWDNSATDGVSLRSSNGTTRLFVREDGNVGIGEASPNAKLDVPGNVKLGSAAHSSWTDAKQDVGGVDIFIGSGSKAFQIWDDNEQNYPRFIVERTGNVGIGTTSPDAKLEVNGNIKAADTTGKFFSNVYTVTTAATADTFSHSGNGLWEYIIRINPNPAGSGSYTDFYYGKLGIGTGWNGSNVTDYIWYQQDQTAPRDLYPSGGGNKTISFVMVSGGSEVTSVNTGTTVTIRVKGFGGNSYSQNIYIYFRRLA